MVQQIVPGEQPSTEIATQITAVDPLRLQQNRQLLLMQLAQGNSLQQILNSLIYGIEGADPLLTGAVLLRQMSGNKLELIAAPSLEPATRQTLLEAEKHVGSGICGQALLSGERIVFTDFRHHPCPACRNLGMLPQFAACWAEPMRNRQGEIIGVFVLYNRQPVHPDLNQIALLTHSASLARLAIEHCRAKLALSMAHTNWQAAQPITLVTDLDNRILNCSVLFTALSGYRQEALFGKNLSGILSSQTSHVSTQASFTIESKCWAGELWLHKQNQQQPEAVWASIDMIFNKNGVICGKLVRLYPITDWNGDAVTRQRLATDQRWQPAALE